MFGVRLAGSRAGGPPTVSPFPGVFTAVQPDIELAQHTLPLLTQRGNQSREDGSITGDSGHFQVFTALWLLGDGCCSLSVSSLLQSGLTVDLFKYIYFENGWDFGSHLKCGIVFICVIG